MKVYMDHEEHTAVNFHLFIHTLPIVLSAKLRKHKIHKIQFKKIVKPFLKSITVVDYYMDNFPEFALYGHTMMSKSGPAVATPGGFSTK